MEIHELNTFGGTLGSGDYFATDNGADTSKVSAEAMFAPLNARIDNIIAGGAAPSPEEITDARLGADGITYSSLGAAIRTQITNAMKSMSAIVCTGEGCTYDNVTRTLTIPQGFIEYHNNVYALYTQTIDLRETPTTYNAWVLRYHRGTSADDSYIYAEAWNADSGSEDNLIGYVYGNIAYINGLKNKYGVPFAYLANSYNGFKGFIAWDNNTKKITVGDGGFVVTERGTVNLLRGEYDLSSVVTTADAYQVIFNPTNSTITARAWNTSKLFTGYLIGLIYGNAFTLLDNGANILESRQVVHCFGDSITAGVGQNRAFHLDLAMADNVICYNWGVGSTGYVATASGSVVAGNGVIGDGSSITASGNNSVLDVMTGKTFSACVIFAGTNDYGGSVALDTFRTAVQNTLDYALEQTSNILVITPIKRVGYMNQNQRGATLADYADIIKEECASRNIGCFDGFDIPIDPTDARHKNRFAPDGLHPNDLGQRMIAGAIRSAFETYCAIL